MIPRRAFMSEADEKAFRHLAELSTAADPDHPRSLSLHRQGSAHGQGGLKPPST